jgi:hypothetical protein
VQVHDWLCWPLLLCGFEHFIWTFPMGNLFVFKLNFVYSLKILIIPPDSLHILWICWSFAVQKIWTIQNA